MTRAQSWILRKRGHILLGVSQNRRTQQVAFSWFPLCSIAVFQGTPERRDARVQGYLHPPRGGGDCLVDLLICFLSILPRPGNKPTERHKQKSAQNKKRRTDLPKDTKVFGCGSNLRCRFVDGYHSTVVLGVHRTGTFDRSPFHRGRKNPLEGSRYVSSSVYSPEARKLGKQSSGN